MIQILFKNFLTLLYSPFNFHAITCSLLFEKGHMYRRPPSSRLRRPNGLICFILFLHQIDWDCLFHFSDRKAHCLHMCFIITVTTHTVLLCGTHKSEGMSDNLFYGKCNRQQEGMLKRASNVLWGPQIMTVAIILAGLPFLHPLRYNYRRYPFASPNPFSITHTFQLSVLY